MALERTALRIAAVEALAPAAQFDAATPSWPTLAGNHVYDSEMSPIDDLSVDEKRPIVIVYSERDQSTFPQDYGGAPIGRSITLRIEMSVVAAIDVDGETYIVALPTSAPEVEAQLDLLEDQVMFALRYGATGALYRKIGGARIVGQMSEPDRSGEEAVRIAMRTLTLTLAPSPSCTDPSPAIAATGLDRLPEPLRTVAQALPASSYATPILATLAAAVATPPVRTPLDKIRFDVAVADPQGEQDDATDMELEIPIDQDE